jgi:predicted RNase H-like nuclease (RuvC/YqgF family)
MEQDSVAALRADVAALRGDVMEIRQDIGGLEAKADSFEAWRVRYLVQEDQLIGKLFLKIDELVASLSDMRADLSRMRGEREAERRASMMIVSVLSAACGGLLASLLHG